MYTSHYTSPLEKVKIFQKLTTQVLPWNSNNINENKINLIQLSFICTSLMRQEITIKHAQKHQKCLQQLSIDLNLYLDVGISIDCKMNILS